MKLWEGLSQDLNYNVMFSQRGVLNLGHTLQDMRDISRRVNANRLNGIDGEVLDAQGVKEVEPMMDCSDRPRYPVMGASFQPRAGVARHDAVAWGYARAADALGVDLFQQCEVNGFIKEDGAAIGVTTKQHGELFPCFSRVRMNRQWGGIVDTTADACPIMSATPVENLFFNCGWGTGGFKATPGSGHAFAETLALGEASPLAKPFSMFRFHDGALIDEHGAAGVAH